MKTFLLLALFTAFTLRAVEPMILPALPEPFTNGAVTYHNPKILAVDSNGLKFQHDAGVTTIPPDQLDPAVKRYITNAMAAINAASNPAPATTATSPSIAPPAKPTPAPIAAPSAPVPPVDPEALTKGAKVTLTGQVQGGKSRYEPWKTDYGSYQRTDTSSYQLMCTLKTLVQTPQRVRMQAFRLSRNLETKGFDVKLVGDFKVTYGGHIPTTVSAICEATNTDEKYVALGIRDRGGDKYLGWIWRAIDGNNHIIALISSQSAYDKLGYEQPVR